MFSENCQICLVFYIDGNLEMLLQRLDKINIFIWIIRRE